MPAAASIRRRGRPRGERPPRPLGLWALTRRGAAVSLSDVARAVGRSPQYLHHVALGAQPLSPAVRRAILAAAARLGLADPARLLEPFSEEEHEAMTRLAARHGARRREAFVAFREHQWDLWKGRKKMIPDAALEYFHFARNEKSETRDPFSEPWEDAAVWPHPQARAVDAQVQEALMKGELLLIKGPSGSGKTVLARTALAKLLGEARSPRLAGRRFNLARLLTLRRREATGCSLVRALFRDFLPGATVPGNAEDMVGRIAKEIAAGFKGSSQNYGVLLEEAHELSMATLLDLKKLRETVADYGGALGVILVAQTQTEPDIDVLLADSRVVAVRRRLYVIEVAGLSPKEAREYVAWRLARAGARPGIVTPAAVDYLLEILSPGGRSGPSQLYPAELDVRLSQAFVAAWEKGARTIDRRMVSFALRGRAAGPEPETAETATA